MSRIVRISLWIFLLLMVIGLVIATSACSGGGCSLTKTAESVGLADPAPPERVLINIVCDRSLESSCTADTLAATIERSLAHIATRPGSRLRVWMLGERYTDTTMIAKRESPVPSGKSAKTREANRARWRAEALDYLRMAAQPYFGRPQPRRSPIAEGIAQVALAESDGLQEWLVAVTDGRETAIARFECKPPTVEQFLTALDQRQVLAPGSLDGITVAFTHLKPTFAKRCRAGIDREQRIRDAWRAALTRAGATNIRLSTSVVSFDSSTSEAGR